MQLSQIEQEFIIFCALHQALAETAARIGVFFGNTNALSGIDTENVFANYSEVVTESVAGFRESIKETFPEPERIFEFLRKNQLNLSWKPKK